jgi:hypothetical protein
MKMKTANGSGGKRWEMVLKRTKKDIVFELREMNAEGKQKTGSIKGTNLSRCLPAIYDILSRAIDEKTGIPLEAHRHVKQFIQTKSQTTHSVALDEEAYVKIRLLARLQERVSDGNRVELMALRIKRFSREEAMYWLSRTLHYGETGNRWAVKGLRIMLCGEPNDPNIKDALSRFRA